MLSNISIKINSEVKDAFLAIGQGQELTQSQILELLIETYNKAQNTEKESKFESELEKNDEVRQAIINNNGLTFEQLATEGILQRARYYNTIAEKKSQLENMSNSELKSQTSKGVAEIRIEKAVNAILNHNDLTATTKRDKIFISASMVSNLTGSNPTIIKKVLERMSQILNDHHTKHDLKIEDNRKGKNFDYKQVLNWED